MASGQRSSKRQKFQNFEGSSSDTETTDSTSAFLSGNEEEISLADENNEYAEQETDNGVSRQQLIDNDINADGKDKAFELFVSEEQMAMLIQRNKIGDAFMRGKDISKINRNLRIKMMFAECCLRRGSAIMTINHVQELLKDFPKFNSASRLDKLGNDCLACTPPMPFRAMIFFACASVSRADAQRAGYATDHSDLSITLFSSAAIKIKEDDVEDWQSFTETFLGLVKFVYEYCFVHSPTESYSYHKCKRELNTLKFISEACMHLKLLPDAATYCKKAIGIINEDKAKCGKLLMEAQFYGDLLDMLGKATGRDNPKEGTEWLKKALSAKKKIKFDDARSKNESIENTKAEIEKLKKNRN